MQANLANKMSTVNQNLTESNLPPGEVATKTGVRSSTRNISNKATKHEQHHCTHVPFQVEIVRVLGKPHSSVWHSNEETQDHKVFDPRDGHIRSSLDYDSSIDDRLPETVKLLTTQNGTKVYLIGTAHFSEESQKDVRMIMHSVKPQTVLVELCKLRADILKLDASNLIPAQSITASYVIDLIKKHGAYTGLFHLLLVKTIAELSDELDMLPGGEFRTAFKEAQQIPDCPVYLVDRPLNITIQRTVRSMSLYEMFRLCLMILTMSTKISKEEVELGKKQCHVTEFETKLKAHFPAFNEVFVTERDKYLSYMFHACIAHKKEMSGVTPTRVVGVVGLGHTAGIIQHWGKITCDDVINLLSIPPEQQSIKILRFTFKATLIGAFVYMGYRYIPLPSTFVLKSIKSSVDGLKHFGSLVSKKLL